MQYALPVCGKILPFYACLGTIQRRKFTSIKHTKIMSDARTDSVWFSECANILKVFASPMTRSKWTLLLAIILSRKTVLWPNRFCFLKNVGMFTVTSLGAKMSLKNLTQVILLWPTKGLMSFYYLPIAGWPP